MQSIQSTPIKPALVNFFVPEALEIRDGGQLLIVVEYFTERRHLTTIGNSSCLYGLQQLKKRMVPGMGAAV